ncbi:MAG: 3-deoxy-7-phosphoheptulonate synthase [Myxococcales bacterium]|nr:3-deoxy-7-phosphoheptulonate synthase [Myxococcales bacterium]
MQLDDINVISFKPLITPDEIRQKIPLPQESAEVVAQSRQIIANILMGKDPRKIIIMGPCSIHDPKSALEYAARLRILAREVSETLFIVMRTYFEKPRTTVGWKGFINDPQLDNSFKMNEGLEKARKLLIEITKQGVPVATESLDPITPQYLAELISWTAIGARTTESQTHRELSSGLSSPVGFKNNTDGNIEVAINAIKSSQRPHHFLGIDEAGQTSIVATRGNSYSHLILRGGKEHPNYDAASVKSAQLSLEKAGLLKNLIIDCSHDNSLKDYRKQPQVFRNCIEQIASGNQHIVGLMLESHLFSGKQELSCELKYGVSITDGCIDFDESTNLCHWAYQILRK